MFEQLRQLRQQVGGTQNVPAFVIFGDASLREMARRRPSTLAAFHQVAGVGDKKRSDYGQAFVDCISAYCHAHELSMDVPTPPVSAADTGIPHPDSGPSMSAISAFPLFHQGLSVAQVCERMDRASSTVCRYLYEYLRHERICDPSPWVDAAAVERITRAGQQVGTERLKPIYEHLEGQIDYDRIRIVVTCLQNAQQRQELERGRRG